MSNIDDKIKDLLYSFEHNYVYPTTLNEVEQKQAQVLIKQLVERVRELYGTDIHASYKVEPSGATLRFKSYCIYSAYDFMSFIDEDSGYLSASHLLDELAMSFNPCTSHIIKRMTDDGFDAVIDAYLPSQSQLNQVDTSIHTKNIPTTLLRAISKAYVIKAFICECLGLEANSNNELSMQLTITALALTTVIKRGEWYYEINGVNDIHNAILGFAPTNDFSDITEDCTITMYKKLGVDYIPDFD